MAHSSVSGERRYCKYKGRQGMAGKKVGKVCEVATGAANGSRMCCAAEWRGEGWCMVMGAWCGVGVMNRVM